MSVTLQPLLDLRALLDSLLSSWDNGSSSKTASDSREKLLRTREMRPGYPARVSVFAAECSVTGEEAVTETLTERPSNVPVNAESESSCLGFSDR